MTKASDKSKETPQKKWGWTLLKIIGLLVWVGAVVIIAQFVVGFLLIALFGYGVFEYPVTTGVFSALYYLLAVCIIIYLPPIVQNWFNNKFRSRTNIQRKPKARPLNKKELGLQGLPTWTDIGLAIVGFIVYVIIAAALSMLFMHFSWFNADEAQDVGFNFIASQFDRMIAFITLVIVAPVAEEVIFRGWLYKKIRNILIQKTTQTITIVITTLLVSLLFGLIHGQWNVGINVFALSLVLCILREINGTIYSGILLHMLKNGVAFYLLYVAGFGF